MRFKSPRYPGFTAVVRHEAIPRHPVTGDLMPDQKIPAIRAEFGVHDGEFTYIDPDTTREEVGANIRGGIYDTQVAQEQNGWTDDEREMVERRLLTLCQEWPEAVQIAEDAPAAAPWPSYDQMTNYLEIAKTAETIGALNEALAYERQNKQRDGVLTELEKRIHEQKDDESLVAA